MSSKNNPFSYDDSIKEKARLLRNNPTPAEKLFWNTLRRMAFYKPLTFNRQKPIGPYIVDFYCYQVQLVIEIDGHSHGETKTKVNDQKRTEFLEGKGLIVLRFANAEVESNIEGVMARLEAFIVKERKSDVNHPSPL